MQRDFLLRKIVICIIAFSSVFTLWAVESSQSFWAELEKEPQNFEKLVQIIKSGISVNTKKDGQTPLCWAIESKDPALVKFLLKQSADLELADKNGKKPRALVRSLIEEIARKISTSVAKPTVFFDPIVAADLLRQKESLQKIKQLLLDAKQSSKKKPLPEKEQQSEPIKRDPGQEFWTLVQASTVKGQVIDTSQLKEKLDAGHISIDVIDVTSGLTPLGWAVVNKNKELFQFLLDNGVDVNQQHKNRQTELHIAVIKNDAKAVEVLLNAGARADLVDAEGKTPVYYAVKSGNFDFVEKLLKQPAALSAVLVVEPDIVHAADGKGNTLHTWATKRDDKKALYYLKLYETSPTQHVPSKTTPGPMDPHKGIATHKEPEQKQPEQKKPEPLDDLSKQFWQAFTKESVSVDVLNQLLKQGVSINTISPSGMTPLGWAVKNSKKSLVLWSLQNGASIAVIDSEGRTPLHYAIENGDFGTIQDLLKKPETLNSIFEKAKNITVFAGDDGMTLLHLAIAHGGDKDLINLIKNILALGASIDQQDGSKKTALHWAILRENIDVVKLLLDKQPNLDLQDLQGRNPLVLASGIGNKEIVDLLLKAGAKPNTVVPSDESNKLAQDAVRRRAVELEKTYGQKVKDVFKNILNALSASNP